MQNPNDDGSGSGAKNRELANAINDFNRRLRRGPRPLVQATREPSKDTEPNWGKWTRTDAAPLWQLAALLAGLDPDSITIWQIVGGVEFEPPVDGKFNELFDLALSSLKAGKLRALGLVSAEAWRNYLLDVEMPEFLRWARSKRLAIPAPLAEMIGASQVADAGSQDDRPLWSEYTGHGTAEVVISLKEMSRVFEEAGGCRLGQDKPRVLREILKHAKIELENVGGRHKKGRKQIARGVLIELAGKYKTWPLPRS